jgi:hypothetical protein
MASPDKAPFAPCKLCGTPSTLQWSHIVPCWTYKRVIKTAGPGNGPKLVNLDVDTAIFGGEQLAEWMLDTECEQRFGTWENYISKQALQTDDSFPALTAAKQIPGLVVGNWRVVDLSGLDVGKLVRFAASVVWRASKSTVHFPSITLGPYESAFAAYLLDDDPLTPLPECARLLVQLIDDQTTPRVDRGVSAPWRSKEGSYHVHHFAMFGMWFQMMVGGAIHPAFDQFCLSRTGRGIVTDGSRLLGLVSGLIGRVTPKGALADRK